MLQLSFANLNTILFFLFIYFSFSSFNFILFYFRNCEPVYIYSFCNVCFWEKFKDTWVNLDKNRTNWKELIQMEKNYMYGVYKCNTEQNHVFLIVWTFLNTGCQKIEVCLSYPFWCILLQCLPYCFTWWPDPVAYLGVCPTFNQDVAGSILCPGTTILSLRMIMNGHSLPSDYSRRSAVSYRRKNVRWVLAEV